MLNNQEKKRSNLIENTIKLTKNNLLQQFIRSIYSDVSHDDLKDFSKEELLEAAQLSFNFFKQRKKKESLIHYSKITGHNSYGIIHVVADDMPFIVDSVNNELKQQQIDIFLVSHPILRTVRDKAGKLLSFDNNGACESIMHIHVGAIKNDAQIKDLVSTLKIILECISFSVQDWRKMTSIMQEVADDLRRANYKNLSLLNEESIDFLEWLISNNFVFLGYVDCTYNGKAISIVPHSELGLMRAPVYKIDSITYEAELQNSYSVFIKKWKTRSIVHRTSHFDVIVVKKFDNNGTCTGAGLFFGLFTSTVYYQSVRNIPLMRTKVKQVIARYGYPETSHNCKELVTALESFPRGEILQMTVDELYHSATGIVKLSLIPKVKVFLRKDKPENFISCIIFIPEKRFSTENRLIIEGIICKNLHGIISKRYIQMGEANLSRLQLIVRVIGEFPDTITEDKIEKEIIKAVSVWSDDLQSALLKHFDKSSANSYYDKYKEAFDIKYTSIFPGSKAAHDIKFLENNLQSGKVCFDVYHSSNHEKHYMQLKIFSPGKELPLSSTLPKIEHLGFFVHDMQTYEVDINHTSLRQKIYIHHFKAETKLAHIAIDSKICSLIAEALTKVWDQAIENDAFNSLIIATNTNWRLINVLRAYAKYLKQTKYLFSVEYTLEVLLKYYQITRNIIELFELKFNPEVRKSKKAIEDLIDIIKAGLNGIKSLPEDKVMRNYLQLMIATVRTNFYQNDKDGNFKEYISFKINSKEAPDLPEPRPYMEIFVYSARFEAIHLRGGKVARGGIRWSDRKEDFRTEVLGLMKAQMTKNSVIVPVGSKGGFILKSLFNNDNRDLLFKEGIECYKMFLSGMLDITDNIVSSKVVPPKFVIRYDEDDPYLVVAADKGTATFSDYANEVSESYGFWLNDAFASGGSAGYDHKKMGITAKGGWISVVRHFQEMEVDINKAEFTCVGIGDMSGDVFGNGMLLSDNIKLVAAFNHLHIFLDPNPNSKDSFKERKRLFNLPRSQWSDYNAKLISKGGGIYERKLKSITISGEIQKLLNIKDYELSTDDLIKAILKAPVDLLWNGGIGTYVKSKLETNDVIGDKSNDTLRVNGAELKCRIFAEGGNLGCTQLGRIEYARAGGRINTDFIDNSAGVDCSDHEVNIKIALSDYLRTGKLKRKERDILLEKMTNDVGKLVLQDNLKQTQILTLEQLSVQNKIFGHSWLIRHLESNNVLDRAIEFLPSEEELKKLIAEKQRLNRPEVAVLLAYAKNSALNLLNKYDLSEDKYFLNYLHHYFPKDLNTKYRKLIEQHKLKKEIIATVLVNDFVNTLGCSVFHQILDETGHTPEQIIKTYAVVKPVFCIDELWAQVEAITTEVPIAIKLELFVHLQELIERNVTWLLNNKPVIKDIGSTIDALIKDFSTLKVKAAIMITSGMKKESNTFIQRYSSYKKISEIVSSISLVKSLGAAFDIIKISKNTGRKLEDVASVFFRIEEQFHIRWLIEQVNIFAPRQYFQIFALRALVIELQQLHMHLTTIELKLSKTVSNNIKLIDNNLDKFNRYVIYIDELKAGDITDTLVSKLTVAAKKIKDITL